MGNISQMPVVLMPIHFDRSSVKRVLSTGRSIALRPFKTNDFSTGVPLLPGSTDLPIKVTTNFFDQNVTKTNVLILARNLRNFVFEILYL